VWEEIGTSGNPTDELSDPPNAEDDNAASEFSDAWMANCMGALLGG